MADNDDLNPQQREFCAQYIANGFNGTKAAIAAGYAHKSAEVTASRLLSKDKIKAFIDARQNIKQIKTDITREKVLAEFLSIAAEARTEGNKYAKTAIEALDRICKMMGYYITENANESGVQTSIVEIPDNGRANAK